MLHRAVRWSALAVATALALATLSGPPAHAAPCPSGQVCMTVVLDDQNAEHLARPDGQVDPGQNRFEFGLPATGTRQLHRNPQVTNLKGTHWTSPWLAAFEGSSIT